MALPDRFWAKVDRSAGPTSCWPWTASLDSGGYGRFGMKDRPAGMDRAHRLSLQDALGRPLLAGAFACHRCNNRRCVNPAHLYEGDAATNHADAARVGHAINSRDHRGEGNGNSKLTAVQVEAIRSADLSRYGTGIALARALGVTYMTVYEIRHGTKWAHLGGPSHR